MKDQIESSEELWFSWYLDDLKSKGYVLDYTYHCVSIILNKVYEVEYIKKLKRKEDRVLKKTIIPSRVYTPDFQVFWNPEIFGDSIFKWYFNPEFADNKLVSTLEIKGAWDQNNMTRLFKQNQTLIWELHSKYVQLVKLPSLFKETFTPKRYLFTDKTMKRRKISFVPRLINEFLQSKPPTTPRFT